MMCIPSKACKATGTIRPPLLFLLPLDHTLLLEKSMTNLHLVSSAEYLSRKNLLSLEAFVLFLMTERGRRRLLIQGLLRWLAKRVLWRKGILSATTEVDLGIFWTRLY